ncbi:MAG: hypothetical protein ACPGUT_13475, partial [Halocynthiibacter sp.]
MEKKLKLITKITSAAIMAGTVFIGQSAVAAPVRYDCTFHNSERSRGWIPAQLFVTVDEDAGRVTESTPKRGAIMLPFSDHRL